MTLSLNPKRSSQKKRRIGILINSRDRKKQQPSSKGLLLIIFPLYWAPKFCQAIKNIVTHPSVWLCVVFPSVRVRNEWNSAAPSIVAIVRRRPWIPQMTSLFSGSRSLAAGIRSLSEVHLSPEEKWNVCIVTEKSKVNMTFHLHEG